MAEYNLSEFRAQTKKAFDEAERGESVVIERHGEDFYLITRKEWNDTILLAQKGVATLIPVEVSSHIAPDVVLMDSGVSQANITNLIEAHQNLIEPHQKNYGPLLDSAMNIGVTIHKTRKESTTA